MMVSLLSCRVDTSAAGGSSPNSGAHRLIRTPFRSLLIPPSLPFSLSPHVGPSLEGAINRGRQKVRNVKRSHGTVSPRGTCRGI